MSDLTNTILPRLLALPTIPELADRVNEAGERSGWKQQQLMVQVCYERGYVYPPQELIDSWREQNGPDTPAHVVAAAIIRQMMGDPKRPGSGEPVSTDLPQGDLDFLIERERVARTEAGENVVYADVRNGFVIENRVDLASIVLSDHIERRQAARGTSAFGKKVSLAKNDALPNLIANTGNGAPANPAKRERITAADAIEAYTLAAKKK